MEIAAAKAKGRSREDRIGKLGDDVLGHIVSFLPSQEAARAAALSTRWRHVFAGVHTLSLEEPEIPIPDDKDDDDNYCYSPGYGRPPMDPDPPIRFAATVTAAIVARHRGPAAAPPLRALRVALNDYTNRDLRAVDQCVSYAMKQAGPTLVLDLCLRRAPLQCHGAPYRRPCFADASVIGLNPQASCEVSSGGDATVGPEQDRTVDDDGDDAISSEDEAKELQDELPPAEYAVPTALFSCSVLRVLRIGPCRLSPPPAISLPSLRELLLSGVSDDEHHVQRLISACPRLADLTLETCHTVTGLSLFDTRLRRLALRCCHNLASVSVDVSELDAFEYRGAVPRNHLLDTYVLSVSGRWFTALPLLSTCTVDICSHGLLLASSWEVLADLTWFVHNRFQCAVHLHLRSARLGFGIGALPRLPAFLGLQHLELRGHLSHQDAATIAGAMYGILSHAPNLEVLSLIFETEPQVVDSVHVMGYGCKERELLDAHHLKYNRWSVIDAPSAMIPCLTYHVREINLVHYQGGQAQRTLAKFLISSAPVLDRLFCQFAEGPLWIQTQLMQEMKGWVMNNKANTVFR